MQIVTYRELEPKDDFMMLMEIAFWWPISPKTMQERIETDVRLKHGPVGFCAVKDGRLIGFVGVMDIPTKTVAGETEIIGGVWAVATNPGFARQGICKTLMENALDYFRLQNYRFSFLCTSRTIIAHHIYREMGYEEVESANQYDGVYKVLDKPESANPGLRAHLDPHKAYRIYETFVKGKVGFVVRQSDFVAMYLRRKRFDESKSILLANGYALLSENQDMTKIQEMVALDYDTYEELIDKTEISAKAGVINRAVADPKLLDIYKSRGYGVHTGNNNVLMVKPLKEAWFSDAYGDSFYIGGLDWF